ncbi:tetratricopeptide repeat-containing sensor histidine kinase [Ohtaekwangia sp.]|uniref:tetratricopeptide repeat-containing sensor histidine kinase n=1 Tax=Ohtaekwangia sp. TaxID=2066019 RepID=UPI002F94F526
MGTTDVKLEEGKALLREAFACRINNLQKSIALAEQVVKLGEQADSSELCALAKNQLALYHMILGEHQKSLSNAEEALTFFDSHHDLKGIGDAKYAIAGVHYKTDNFHLGLIFLLDCLFLYRKISDHYNEARVLKSLGTIYEYLDDQENAIDSYLSSVAASKLAGDPTLESNAYNPLSGIYLKRGLHDLALATIEKSISLKEQTNDVRGLAFALYGRGKVFIKLKRFDEALQDLNHCLKIQLEVGDKLGIAMAYNKLGVLMHELRQFEEARKLLLLAQQVADQYNIRVIRYKSVYNLHHVAKSEGKLDEALHFLEQYIHIKEAIIATDTHKTVKSYEAISKVKVLELEAEIQRSKTEIIEKKNAELDSFFYRVSHDLKGPISSLLGLNNLMKYEVKDEKLQKYIDMYQSQILRIDNIVLDLINLTRMNHAEVNKTKIDFETLLHDCINTYQFLDNFKRISFKIEIEPNLEFYSEWAIVNTILQNLIENAIKYSMPDKEPIVHISIARDEQSLIIIVTDNGIGIDPLLQTKVFNMFFRANDRVEGTGLGLYILKRAVERLHGDVSFKSEVFQGTSFTVKLPFFGRQSIL